MVRFVFVLLIFDFISRYSASVPYTIKLTAKKYNYVIVRHGRTVPSLMVNMPFEIHIYSDAHVLGVQCKNEKFKLVHFDSYIRYHRTYYAPINNLQTIATAAMNGTWWCVLYYPPYGQETTQFNLQLDIRGSGSPEMQPKKNDTESSSDSIWYISSVGATIITAILVTATVRGRRQKTSVHDVGDDNGDGNSNGHHVYESVNYSACGNPGKCNQDSNGDHRTAEPCDGDNEGKGVDNHAYESVHYLEFVNPVAVSSTDVASRPPHPLPPEEYEGTQNYVHYDTVYAERLEHMMMMDQLRRQARK